MRYLEGTLNPKVFIGNRDDACNKEYLYHNDIKVILNVCNDIDTERVEGFDIIYLKWGLDDPKEGLANKNDVQSAAMLLNMAVNTPARSADTLWGNVLIHCASGHNRCAIVAAYWLAAYKAWEWKRAILTAQVKDKKDWMIDKGLGW